MIKTINPHDIIIGPRAREVGDISALVHSIQSTGILIHPPTVVQIKVSTPKTDGLAVHTSKIKYKLISGARRLTAVIQLKWTEIPVTVIPCIDNPTALLLELDENRRRENFKWQEEIVLKCNVFFVMQKTQPQLKQVWFAEEILGESAGMFSIEMELFKGKDEFPEIMEIESLTKAREHLRKLRLNNLIKERQRRKQTELEKIGLGLDALQGKHGTAITVSAPIDPESEVQYHLTVPSYKIYPEAIEMLKSLPSDSIDCCVTDPPFGIGVQSARDRSDGAQIYDFEDTPQEYFKLMGKVLRELEQVLVPGAHMYMFFSFIHYEQIKKNLNVIGFDVWPHPLIWVKLNYNLTGNPGSCGKVGYAPPMTYFPILFCWKTKGTMRRNVKPAEPNVIIHPPISPSVKDHPLNFPVDVYANLMTRSCYPGDTIVDPFCGTGNSIKAGLINGFNMIGSEKMEMYRVLAEEKARETVEKIKC